MSILEETVKRAIGFKAIVPTCAQCGHSEEVGTVEFPMLACRYTDVCSFNVDRESACLFYTSKQVPEDLFIKVHEAVEQCQ